MAVLTITPPYPLFTDADGTALDNGYVYIGEPYLDPQANPVAVYWDAALTIPAAQPLRTLNGYFTYNGAPANVYIGSDYSMRVANKNNAFIYSFASASAPTIPGSFTVDRFSGDGLQTTFILSVVPGTTLNTQVYIDGVYQNKDTYVASGSSLQFSEAPPLGTDNIEVVMLSTYSVGVVNADNVIYDPAGTGAVATTVQTKLRESVSVKDFGAVGDGVTDDTVAIQAAIEYANSLNGYIEITFEPGKTYLTSGLIPKSGVLLNLQGATLFLKNAANTPIFFDGNVGNGNNFGVINGIFDCNQTNNNGLNVLGGVWLTGWTNLQFENLTIKNCFRIGLNLVGCSFLNINGYRFEDSGVAGAFHAYGLNIEKSTGVSKYIVVKNVSISNVVGFGVHFFGCEDFEASNFNFDTMSFSTNLAIAITFTQAKRGTCNNVYCNAVLGSPIEINGSTDLVLENYEIVGAGDRALLTGSAIYGYNTRIRISNFSDTATAGTFSAALNYLTDCVLERVNFSKPVSILTGLALSRNNVVRDSSIGSTVSTSPGLTSYDYFKLENVRFTNYTFRNLNDQEAVVSSTETVNNGAVFALPIADIISTTALGNQGSVAGTLKTLTRFTGAFNQGSYQTCSFLVNDAGTAANLSAVTQVNSATARALTIAGDAASKSITLTNGTGVNLTVSWTLEMVTFL